MTFTIPSWVPGVPTADALNVQESLNEIQETIAGESEIIPLCYGACQIGGRIYASHYDTNSDTWTVGYIFCLGEIGGFSSPSLLINGAAVVAGVSVNLYTGTTSQGADPLFASVISGYSDTLVFNNELGAVGVAHAVIQYTSEEYSNFPDVKANLFGRKVFDPVSGTKVYSNSPALCLADVILDPLVGLGELVDNASLTVVRDDNAATVTTQPRRTLGLSITRQQETTAIIEVLRGYAGCWVYQRGGTWHFASDRPRGVDASYDANDMVNGSFKLGQASPANIPTIVKIRWTDTTSDIWQEKIACYPATLSSGTVRRESVVSMPGIQSHAQAMREAKERYQKLQHDETFVFIGFDEQISTEVGDVLSLSHPIGVSNRAFRVTQQPRMVKAGRYEIAGIEYDSADYDDSEDADPSPGGVGAYFGNLFNFTEGAGGNVVYRQATQPSTAAIYDLWFETGTDLLYTYDGANWLLIGNAFTVTSQLTDDASLAGAILGVNLRDSESNVLTQIQLLNQYASTNNMGGELTGNPFMTVVDPLYDRPLGWYSSYSNFDPTNLSYADAERTILRLQSLTDDTIGASGRGFRVNSQTRYRGFIRYRRVGNNVAAGGMYLRMTTKSAAIAQGKNGIGWNTGETTLDIGGAAPYSTAAYFTILSATDTGNANAPGNNIGALFENRVITAADTWYECEFEYSPDASVEWASPQILNWADNGTAAIDVDSFFLYPFGTTNALYTQATQPANGAEGDLWYETGTKLYYQYVGGSWVNVANAFTDTGELVDSAGLGTTATWASVAGTGKPADFATQNNVFRQATTPSAGVTNGDLWYETGTKLWYQRYAGAWVVSASNVSNTNELTDGANLGGTADWSNVTGSGVPEDNATRNDFRGIWNASSISYLKGDMVTNSGYTYICVLAHTSNSGNAPSGTAAGNTWWEVFVTATTGPGTSVIRRNSATHGSEASSGVSSVSHVSAGAEIQIEVTVVGAGSWSGTPPSGGTLRLFEDGVEIGSQPVNIENRSDPVGEGGGTIQLWLASPSTITIRRFSTPGVGSVTYSTTWSASSTNPFAFGGSDFVNISTTEIG